MITTSCFSLLSCCPVLTQFIGLTELISVLILIPVGEGLGCEGRSQRTDEENEVTHKSCWFGGGGEDFSVFLENGQYVVKKRWTQESGGPEVSAEPHGPWEVLFTLP